MHDQQAKTRQSWKKFLNPSSLRGNLIACSLYLCAWEMLRNSVIEQLRAFFMLGMDEDEEIRNRYKTQVLARDKSPLRGSLFWYREMGVVSDADLVLVNRLIAHRNEIAHELPKFIMTMEKEVNASLIAELCELVARIDRWWIREVEIPVNSDFDDQDVAAIPDSELHSGRMLMLQMLLKIATGSDPEASQLYEYFANAWPE